MPTYNKTTWVNEQTPLNSDNLNKIEQGIEDNASAINNNSGNIEALLSSLNEIRQSLNDLQQSNIANENYIENHLQEVTSITNSLNEIKTTLSNISPTITANSTEIATIKTTIAEIETSLANLTANKLDKSNTANQVYGTDINGAQTTIKHSKLVEANVIPITDEDSNINVGAPKKDSHAVNLGHLNQALIDNDNTEELKQYVGDNFVNQNTLSSEATPGTSPVRDSESRIKVGYPTENNHAANKQFVLDEINALKNSTSGGLAFVYKTLADFTGSITTKVESGYKKLVSITMGGKTYTEDKIPLGTDVLLEAKNVPDYWLSSKSIAESDDVIKFFTEYEAKLDLSNYYDIQQMDAKLQERQKAFKHMTGSDIEIGSFTDGEIIFCTASSDFFSANKYYIHNNGVFNPISIGSNISITPSISAFNVTISTGSTLEVGASFNITGFSGTLKKYSDFAKLTVTADGSTVGEITNITSSSFSKTGLSKTITKNSATSVSASIKGYNTSGNQIGTNSKTLVNYYARQYFGIASDNPDLETMTSELATSYYKAITVNTNEIKTYLQSARPSSITLNLSDTPTYVWFIIPTNLSISTMTSGGFNFPFIAQSNITINNQYGVDITYKVYRSANKIYGTTTINLS